ncbi:MAG: hypothetical protein Q7V58_11330 [Actinomycetota bacterium]|nr:hypothetical protein [Actinomycetota bacterium]
MGIEDNYIDVIARAIRAGVSTSDLPDGDTDGLFRLYALLALTKGHAVNSQNVHDAWCVWMVDLQPSHDSLIPYDELPADVRIQDDRYAQAIREALKEMPVPLSPGSIDGQLFPEGYQGIRDSAIAYEQYKLMVSSSEALVSRRQSVNTFFLTAVGALITAVGVVVNVGGEVRLVGFSVAVLALAGFVLCLAWRSLLISFGQLNKGKFAVINRMEAFLPAAVYTAEWEALARGEDKHVYRTFTAREVWVPMVLLVLLGATCLVAIVVAVTHW